MDLNMKQWRSQQQHESDLQQPISGKLTRHLLDPQLQQQQQQQIPSALPIFVPELTGNLSADSSTPATRFPKREMGSYFSLGQWQELELQALIFRHMLAGAAIPPHLLHLVKKSVLNNSSSPSYNYLHQQLQHYPHYHPPLLQSGGAGCWGRGGMDPEPGRCRRTDGKKWRCSRDVVAGHKYCERHMHRGRNRSRKPVEIPPLPSSSSAGGLSGGGGGLKAANGSTPQPLPAMAAGTHFNLSGLSPSIDLFHLNQRPSDSGTENKGGQLETQNEVSAGDGNSSGGQVLRHFFDDWPRSLQDQPENASSLITSSSTSCSLSISSSTPSNPNSDFSLKLSTGNININRDHPEGGGGGGRGGGSRSGVVRGQQLQFNRVASWGTNQVVGPMGPGGPLAEALRSSSSSSSSLAGVLNRSSKSDTSYVTT